MIIKQLFLDEFNKRYGSEVRKYKIGEYHVSSLLGSCLKANVNSWRIKLMDKNLQDLTKLHFFRGIMTHEFLQKLKVWDDIEAECKREIKTTHGKITLLGHADAVKGDTVFEFKSVIRIPWKPKFDHSMQVNAYATMLGLPRAKVIYIGNDADGNYNVKEFDLVQSDFMWQLLVNKAITLHALLKTGTDVQCSCRSRVHDIAWIQYLDTLKSKKK